jgi:flagellar protein FliS
MNANNAAGAYRSTKNETGIEDASPHALIVMLLEGAIERISEAAGALKREDPATFGSAVGKAIGIVDSLRVSLDAERGGDIAQNLSTLYDYMARRLLEANAAKDGALLTEVTELLKDIQVAWSEIPAELHNQ